jgi:light-regulated signal transduction histidine kinase (bacteriophytochrome)
VQVYRELEQRVANRTQQLEAVNRELEAFSYSVSHDLRAPLRGVHGFLGMAVKELGPIGEKPRRFLDRAQANANQMSHLIEDLLKLAMTARQEVRRVPLDLAAISRDILQRRQADEPQRPVEITIADTLLTHGDAGLMTAVMDNLLSNAWKYTAKTGTARIEVGLEPTTDGERVFFVRDNGAGFDSKHAEKLFTPLQRFHSVDEFPGTGIGLATVQRIIHRHGGRVWAQSEPGRGATFYFTCAEKGTSAPPSRSPAS